VLPSYIGLGDSLQERIPKTVRNANDGAFASHETRDCRGKSSAGGDIGKTSRSAAASYNGYRT
jgi:hypothetical protein